MTFPSFIRVALTLGLLGLAASAGAERIKDLAGIDGIRNNQLVGYGLVVGLAGTGDQTIQAPFTVQSLQNMLIQLGITVPQGAQLQLNNVAAVMVTAEWGKANCLNAIEDALTPFDAYIAHYPVTPEYIVELVDSEQIAAE